MAKGIGAEGLTTRFGGTKAPAGVDIPAGSGQVLALLGAEL
jgi:ABC-type branched-subunit amino acid transport system ATPase component